MQKKYETAWLECSAGQWIKFKDTFICATALLYMKA